MSKERLYENDDLALQFNKNPICPFCGSEQETTDLDFMLDDIDDWWNGLEIECGVCSEEFTVERYIEVTYTTRVEDDSDE